MGSSLMRMADRIGLKVFDFSYLLCKPSLKRDLLFFDKLWIDRAHYEASRLFAGVICQLYDRNPEVVFASLDNDLDFLVDSGIVEIVEFKGLAGADASQDPGVREALRGADRDAQRSNERQFDSALTDRQRFDASVSWLISSTKGLLLRARLAATRAPSSDQQHIPFLSGTLQQHLIEFDRRQSVLRIVLDRIPVPNEDTPWEQLLDFRADPDSRHKLAQLRSWIADLGASSLGPGEIQDKLEAGVADFERHLEVHKVQHTRGALEVILVSTAEVLENLATLKLSKALDVLFKVFKEDHSLLEAELGAPGREVAYLEKVERHFSPQS